MNKKSLSPQETLSLYPKHDDTLPSFLSSRVSDCSSRQLLMFEPRSWTYEQLDMGSTLFANGLAVRGIGKGDRVVLSSQNSDLTILLFIAVAKLGAVFIPINPALTDREAVHVLEKSSPDLVVCDESNLSRIKNLTEPFKKIPWLLSLSTIGIDANDSNGIVGRIKEFASDNSDVSFPNINPDDPLVVIFTSGTTGSPKGVVHSHKNFVWAAEAFVERMYLQQEERLLSVFPFFHVNALFYSFGGAIACGGTMITTKKFSASRFWDLAVESGATQFNILAAVGSILGKRPRSEFRKDHKIRKIYGGPISEEKFRLFQNELNVPILIEGYGMSEIPGACNNPFNGEQKLGSIGKPSLHPRFDQNFTEMRIEDDDGNVLAPGETGELVVKTPILFLEYLDEPEVTKSAFRNGWFLTGDVARMDEDGYFYFIARKKDIIRKHGENISGAEVDLVLNSHPEIIEAATIGVPSDLGEEEVLAVLVTKNNVSLDVHEILDWCHERLAPIKIPRYFVCQESLPHTPSHRVEKYLLKQDKSLMSKAIDVSKIVTDINA